MSKRTILILASTVAVFTILFIAAGSEAPSNRTHKNSDAQAQQVGSL